jgi:hypothetical protein
MRCRFANGEVFTITKVPFENIIEAKVAGKTLRYERAPEGPKRLTDESHEQEAYVIRIIKQHFMPGTKQNRHRRSINN